MGSITNLAEYKVQQENGPRVFTPPAPTKADVEKEAAQTVKNIALHAGREGCITEDGTHHLLQPEPKRKADELRCAEEILWSALNEITLERIAFEKLLPKSR